MKVESDGLKRDLKEEQAAQLKLRSKLDKEQERQDSKLQGLLQQMKDALSLQSDDEQGRRSSTVGDVKGNLSEQFDYCAALDQEYFISPFPLDIDELQKQVLLHNDGESTDSHSLVGFADAAAYESIVGKAPNERMTVERRCTESFFCSNFQDQQRMFIEEKHQKSELNRMHFVDSMKQAVQLPCDV